MPTPEPEKQKSTAEQRTLLTVEEAQHLIRTNCPPQTEAEKVFASMYLALLEEFHEQKNLIELRLIPQLVETTTALKNLSDYVAGFVNGLMNGEEGEEEAATEVKGGGNGSSAQDKPDDSQRDQTPFPAGVAASGPPPSSTQPTQPKQNASSSDEGYTSSRTVQVSPIPGGKKAKNGAKEAQ